MTIDRSRRSVLLYCHDTFGLGHLTRTLALSRHLAASGVARSQLIVTGSPLAHRLVHAGDADYVKLPSVVKVGADEYRARALPLELREICALRSDLVLTAAKHFRPDVVIVDHAPAGLCGEVVPALLHVRERLPGARLVLGLRDVVDDAPLVRQAWTRAGAYELLDHVYDAILVYGQREAYDVVEEYGFSARAAAKTRYVGYLGRARNGADQAKRGRRGRPLVVVTAGGGGDGFELLWTAAAAARRSAGSLEWLLVAGPLMAAADRERLAAAVARASSVRLVDFLDDLPAYVRRADAVVSMGGYNTVCEILVAGCPALIVPRVAPRREQLIRANLVARRRLARVLEPAELSAGRLLDDVWRLLLEPPSSTEPLALDGLAAAAEEIDALLTAEEPQVQAVAAPA